MIASAPVIWVLGLAMGGHLSVRVVGKLRTAGGVVLEGVADRLADLPGGVGPAAADLVGGRDALGDDGVHGGRDRAPYVTPPLPVGEHRRNREDHGGRIGL